MRFNPNLYVCGANPPPSPSPFFPASHHLRPCHHWACLMKFHLWKRLLLSDSGDARVTPLLEGSTIIFKDQWTLRWSPPCNTGCATM